MSIALIALAALGPWSSGWNADPSRPAPRPVVLASRGWATDPANEFAKSPLPDRYRSKRVYPTAQDPPSVTPPPAPDPDPDPDPIRPDLRWIRWGDSWLWGYTDDVDPTVFRYLKVVPAVP